MMLEQPRKRPRPGAVPKDTLSLPYLLQATTVALEALSLVFAITLLSSLDQAPSTISGLNWGWAEDITLNGLPGFGAWCAHHFQGHDCEAGVKEVRFRANIFVGLRSGKATVRVWDAIAAELSPEYTSVGLFNPDISATACPLPSGLCADCHSSSVGAVVALTGLLLCASTLLVVDWSGLMRIQIDGVGFKASRLVLHLCSATLLSIAAGLMGNNCLGEEATKITFELGPSMLIAVSAVTCSVIQICIQFAYWHVWRTATAGPLLRSSTGSFSSIVR